MRRTLIELGIAALILLGTIGVYTFCAYVVEDARADAEALSKELRIKSEDAAKVAAAKEALTVLAADEASMQSYLVRQEDIVPFLSTLERKGSALGAALQVVSVSKETSGTRGRILLAVKISGSFDAVQRTLGAIEYGPYDSSVQQVTFDTTTGEGGRTWNAVATFALGTRAKP